MREVVLDTETTGIEHKEGHRIIEIGCVEVIDRRLTGRHYHVYINPQREIDEGAQAVHGISLEFLADKPVFADIADDFMNFISGARLVIHNAAFDVGMMDAEFARLNLTMTRDFCGILDTLALARDLHPGARNNLDALCKRYGIDNSHRDLHGALLDAEILADVYLMMTGGQTDLALADEDDNKDEVVDIDIDNLDIDTRDLKVVRASAAELEAHEKFLELVDKKSDGAIWRRI